MKFKDLVGNRFGRLVVQARCQSLNGDTRKIRWLCLCDCGKTIEVRGDHLTRGKILSCRCLCAEINTIRLTTHGMSNTRTYRIWRDMLNRCHYENYPERHLYGGRGISVCERWRHSFSSFLEDMGEAPSWGSIDRIDPNGNYEPANCRWATSSEQAANRRPRGTCQRVKDRCVAMLQRHMDGETYAAIGRSVGVGESRIRQLVKKAKILQGAA